MQLSKESPVPMCVRVEQRKPQCTVKYLLCVDIRKHMEVPLAFTLAISSDSVVSGLSTFNKSDLVGVDDRVEDIGQSFWYIVSDQCLSMK